MTGAAAEFVHYKRSRFSTRLPKGRRYTSAHYWMAEDPPGLWRVGFTRFATRMLGELVECEFSASPGGAVEFGQTVGWVEGLKAVSDVYSVVAGQFHNANPELEKDITLVDTDVYGRGWLYSVQGQPEPASVDVQGYVAILDATIDKMIESRYDGGAKSV